MSQLFGRKASLVVAAGEKGLDLSQLQFRFSVRQGDVQTPNNSIIRVFNLSDQTAQTIQKEYTRVILQAGYEGESNFGVIFDGTIKQIRRGRENATDTYVDIYAADGDLGLNFAVVNATLAAGASQTDQVAAVQKAFAAQGNPAGYQKLSDSTGGVLPRGKVLFGMARDAMRNLSASGGWSWSIQDGKVQIVPLAGYLPGDAVVLTSKTGMIGIPEQTDQGIQIKSLLNPRLRIGGLVQIDNASINRALINIQFSAINLLASITDDGFYRLYVVEHSGDTRGGPWYSDMTCLAIDASAPAGSSVKAAG